MKRASFNFLILILFELSSFTIMAQQKDTAVVKSPEIKENSQETKKRKFLYFISNRLSEDNKYDVFKVIPTDLYPALIVIRGHMEVIGNPREKRGKISVFNASNNSLIGIYNTSPYTGNYLLILAPNIKYLFKVEVSGYGTTEEIVEVPLKIDYEICQQDLKIKLNEKNNPVLSVNNYFADENEKVSYLRSIIDTTKLNSDHDGLSNNNHQSSNGSGKSFASIDDLVKKQIEEEKKKPIEALTAFKNNDFEKALSLYSSLLKNDPGDPFVNYYYGVCLLKLDRNKAKAINSLLIASSVKEVPYDVFLYLGRAYHLSYLFQDAIKAFETYKGKEKPYDFERNKGSLFIKNCMSGAMLLNEQIDIEVTKRTPVQMEKLLTYYNPDVLGENVRYKTEFFYSTIDKKKQDKFLMCNASQSEYYHVSYGERDQNQTDIYKNNQLPNGALGPNQVMGPEINTSYDENYPYITKDGKTLYFSSKGHNSMGGYDIFKCTRNDSLSPWSKPQNMGYPINSTYDDILYVPDETNNSASYCTNRRNNNFEFTQITLPDHSHTTSIIKGCFKTLDSIPKKEAYITIFNSNTGEIAGVYKTNPNTGQYLMILNSGTKYDLSVEAESYAEQQSTFVIPEKKGDFELKQLIELQPLENLPHIKVTNYFTAAEASKVTFDEAPKTPTNSKQANDNDAKKIVKQKKPKRTAEEASEDAKDLKQALDLFNQFNYQEAALLYQTLEVYLDLEPMDAYRYGVCLFNTKKDKTICIDAFESSKTLKEIPYDVYYYLAKSNQMSYRFSTAINYYKIFKTLCKPEDLTRLNIEQEMTYCNNGIKLVNNPVILEVYGKKHIDQSSIQNSLSDIESGAKILVVTEEMRSSIDKKKNFKSLLYLSPDKNTVLYTSYGENEANGKDIYQLKKLGNGKWSPTPQNLTSINSPLDEEYPSLSKDGKTLYFSSKGYENMGDYDIFKSTWDEKTGSWSTPVNMGSPINSPYDDIYFLE